MRRSTFSAAAMPRVPSISRVAPSRLAAGLVWRDSESRLADAPTLSRLRGRSKADRVFTSTVPPSELASMSGVSDLMTSSDRISPEGSTSMLTPRRLASGDGTSEPLMVMVFMSGPRPRTTTYRPSPWSRCTATPGRRARASAAFTSGRAPMSSATTALTMLSAWACIFRDLRRLDAWPDTTTPSTFSVGCCCACTGKASIAAAMAVSGIDGLSRNMARLSVGRTKPRSVGSQCESPMT